MKLDEALEELAGLITEQHCIGMAIRSLDLSIISTYCFVACMHSLTADYMQMSLLPKKLPSRCSVESRAGLWRSSSVS